MTPKISQGELCDISLGGERYLEDGTYFGFVFSSLESSHQAPSIPCVPKATPEQGIQPYVFTYNAAIAL